METCQKKSLSTAESKSVTVGETKGTKPSPAKRNDECDQSTSQEDLSDSQDIIFPDSKKDIECQICEKSFPTLYELRNHVHFDQKTCGEALINEELLNGHMHVHNETFKWSYCGKCCVSIDKLKIHTLSHSAEKTFVCKLCGKGFARNTKLTNQKKLHEEGDILDEKPIVCKTCGKAFRDKGDLNSHMHVHYEFFKCSYCNKSFLSAYQLKIHAKSHSVENPFVCKTCGENVRHKSELNRHKHIHNETYKCSYCGKCFGSSYKLKVHTLGHTGETPYVCNHCGEGFFRRHELTDHKKLHGIEEIIECSQCEMKFTTKSSLKQHKMIHAEEKPHLCEFCSKSFRNKSDLKRHLRIHTKEKPFSCDVCERSFRQSSTLKTHMTTHTKKRLYQCEKCVAGFNAKNLLKKHEARFHFPPTDGV